MIWVLDNVFTTFHVLCKAVFSFIQIFASTFLFSFEFSMKIVARSAIFVCIFCTSFGVLNIFLYIDIYQ